jgi:hypothetical protein
MREPRFKLIPFDKLRFDQTSNYLIKRLIQRSAGRDLGAHQVRQVVLGF